MASADKKISQYAALLGSELADLDQMLWADTSSTESKRMLFQELKTVLATVNTAQTLTGPKTLISPVLNTPVITWDIASVIGIPTIDTLTSSRASTTTVDIDATYAILFDNVNFTTRKYDAVNITIDSDNSGQNGIDVGAYAAGNFYANWIIGKTDGTVAGLHSLSFSAPTLPPAFLFKKLVGATFCLSIGPVVFRVFNQIDNEVSATNTSILSAGTATSFTSIDISLVVPITAKEIRGNASMTAANTNLELASDSSGTTRMRYNLGAGGGIMPMVLGLNPANTQTIFFRVAANGSTIECNGFILSK